MIYCVMHSSLAAQVSVSAPVGFGGARGGGVGLQPLCHGWDMCCATGLLWAWLEAAHWRGAVGTVLRPAALLRCRRGGCLANFRLAVCAGPGLFLVPAVGRCRLWVRLLRSHPTRICVCPANPACRLAGGRGATRDERSRGLGEKWGTVGRVLRRRSHGTPELSAFW